MTRLAALLPLIVTILPFVAVAASANAADTAAAPARPLARWEHGPASGPGDFPIGVWLQDPRNAAKYKAAGFNLYVGLWEGPTEAQLKALAAAGMPVICEQNAVGLAHRDDRTIVGWMHGDEPDNAQPARGPDGRQTYGPPVPPAKVVEAYQRLRAADPTRPVLLNLGQSVANDEWKGRGSGAKADDYLTYVKGGDILSFDIYPVAGLGPGGADRLWLVPKGIDRLARWSAESPESRPGAGRAFAGGRVVWNCIECTRIGDPAAKATPEQVRAEVWMSLIHGSTGLVYFVHQFKPKFDEHALLDDGPMLEAVTAINRQVRELAPALNAPTVTDGAAVRPATPEAPTDCVVKREGGATYLFAVAMRNAATRGAFQVRDLPAGATAEVLGESRTIPVREGRFEDDFSAYAVHLYRIRPGT